MYLHELVLQDPKFAAKEAYILNSLRRDRKKCEDIMAHINKYSTFGAYKVLLQYYHQYMTADEIIYYWKRAIVQYNSYLVYLIYKDCKNKKIVYNGMTLEELFVMPDWTVEDWCISERVEACKKYILDPYMWDDVVIALRQEINFELGRMKIKTIFLTELQRKLKQELIHIAKYRQKFSVHHFVAVSYLVYQKNYVCRWESKMEAFNLKALVEFLGNIFTGDELEQALEELIYCFSLYDPANYRVEEIETELERMKKELKKYL